MTEGEKKRIYYELRTHDVRVGHAQNYCTTYTFGRYRVNEYGDYINIAKANKNCPGIFVIMKDAEWGDDFPTNDVYAITTAARNKARGKEYLDPYKDRPTEVEINDLTKRFGKKMMQSAVDFLPADISNYKALRTIAEMKHIFKQKLQDYYTK